MNANEYNYFEQIVRGLMDEFKEDRVEVAIAYSDDGILMVSVPGGWWFPLKPRETGKAKLEEAANRFHRKDWHHRSL